MRDAKYPLTSSVRSWFRSSYCTPFSALHSSARNHATWFSMFFSSSKRRRSFYVCSSLPMFSVNVLHHGRKDWTYNLPCRKCICSSTTSSIDRGGLFFKFIAEFSVFSACNVWVSIYPMQAAPPRGNTPLVPFPHPCSWQDPQLIILS
jgi:hypothetical protein